MTSLFTGPETFERKTYYSPFTSYVQSKKPRKEKVDPKQKASKLFYDYWVSNVDSLPPKLILIKHRAAIESLILRGSLPRIAFEMVLPSSV